MGLKSKLSVVGKVVVKAVEIWKAWKEQRGGK